MIRQIFKLPITNYINHGAIDRCLVSTKYIASKRFYSAGSSSPGKKLKTVVYTASVFVLGTSGLVLYAKYDEDFQSWLIENVPGYNSISKTISKDENLLQVYITDPVVSFKDVLLDSASKLIGQEETKGTSDSKEISSKSEKITSQSTPRSVQKSDTPSFATPASIVELEKVVSSAAQDCVQSYNSVMRVVKEYNEGVQRLIDHSFQEIDSRLWSEIGRKQDEKQKLLYIAEAKIETAMKLVDKMESLLHDSTVPTPSDIKQRLVMNMNRTVNNILEIKKKLQSEIMSPSVTDKYWKDVQKARKYFFEELDNLTPTRDMFDSKLHLNDDELNLFLTYAYQKVLYYQSELKRIKGTNEKNVINALGKLKEKDEVIEATVEVELDKARRKLQEEFEKKELALLLDAKRRTRSQVKLQAEAHYDLLKEAILNKEAEMKRKFQRQLEVKIDELKTEGRITIAGMVGRLKGYNDAVKKRLLEKKQARDAQDLWCACQTLRNAVELPRNPKPSIEELKPLKEDVNNIIISSEGDEFVRTVTSTIPKIALDRGVYPKMTMVDRFLKVERMASRLAQVEDSELSMPRLFFSWLQSFLIIRNIDPITSNEVANEAVDISTFSTYDILHRARYWLDRGDFLQAVRYMNLLTGASKAAASEWIAEATILLETLQAADVLLAHACAGSFSKVS